MAFYTEGSPLFQEFLQLAGADAKPAPGLAPLGPEDALLVIDMQADFVLRHPRSNPQGGRFGVPEGENIVPLIEYLIESAVSGGATICATRDYHPHDHCSFNTCGGPFPAHCVQGTAGSHFLPAIGEKLTQAMLQAGPDRVMVPFKAFHEGSDSFGALPYWEGGDGRISKGMCCNDHHLGVAMGCAKAPFTGSLVLKQSALDWQDGAERKIDINAPPDILAVLADGEDRKLRNLQDVLKGKKRIFVCGLALDFCVLDTCLNAPGAGLSEVEVYMILDAARAAHIPGIGGFGTGFLSNPSEVLAKVTGAGLKLADTGSLGPHAGKLPELLPLPAEKAFPSVLAPLGLELADLNCSLKGEDQFDVQLSGKLRNMPLQGLSSTGQRTRFMKLPLGWPGAPQAAVEMCFADPVVRSGSAALELQRNFMSVSASPELCFLAYGGFLLIDAARRVVAVQAVSVAGGSAAELRFEAPRRFNEPYVADLQKNGRFQPVTLPSLLRYGASEFCWIHPHEELVSGPEKWIPSETGAFVYLFAAQNQPPLYFPVDVACLQRPKSTILTRSISQELGTGDSDLDCEKMSELLSRLGCEKADFQALLERFSQEWTMPFSIDAFLAWMWNER